MKKAVTLILALLCLSQAVPAQKKFKPWTQWNEKEALKILNDSPWGQTQVESDLSEMFYSPTSRSGDLAQGRLERGAFNRAMFLNVRIRFLSALPIRQAFARVFQLQQEQPSPQAEKQMLELIHRRFDEWIVVAVDYDSSDWRVSGPAMQLFASATTGTLKNDTYLELKNGSRNFLAAYQPPGSDGLGAQFFFAREVDDVPFIDADAGRVRFYSEVGSGLRLDMRFDVADFIYEGVLQY